MVLATTALAEVTTGIEGIEGTGGKRELGEIVSISF